MSKAKQRALEKYPLLADDDKEGLEALKYVGMECECAAVYNEVQESKQAYYIEGYYQAEKDLALTWEDIKQICDMAFEEACRLQRNMKSSLIYKEQHYQEVLKRFKNLKK